DSLAAARWVAEDLVGVGPVRLGLPGLSALAMIINPMLEVVPRIRRERDVGMLPMLPYTAMTVCGVIWFVYGVLQGIMSVAIINAVMEGKTCTFALRASSSRWAPTTAWCSRASALAPPTGCPGL
ncbi:unnamed protein product, partial [Prorocentrum cordatum]